VSYDLVTGVTVKFVCSWGVKGCKVIVVLA